MCQALPGNRCSAHSVQRMANTAQRAKAYLDKHGADNREELTVEQTREYDKLAAKARAASEDFDSTVNGISHLSTQIRNLDDTVESREANRDTLERLRKRRERGVALRDARRDAFSRVKLATLQGKQEAAQDGDIEERINALVDAEIAGVPRHSSEYAIHKAQFLESQMQQRIASIRTQRDTYRSLMSHISKEVRDSDTGVANPRLYELCTAVSSSIATRERERDALKARIIQLNLSNR